MSFSQYINVQINSLSHTSLQMWFHSKMNANFPRKYFFSACLDNQSNKLICFFLWNSNLEKCFPSCVCLTSRFTTVGPAATAVWTATTISWAWPAPVRVLATIMEASCSQRKEKPAAKPDLWVFLSIVCVSNHTTFNLIPSARNREVAVKGDCEFSVLLLFCFLLILTLVSFFYSDLFRKFVREFTVRRARNSNLPNPTATNSTKVNPFLCDCCWQNTVFVICIP